MASFNQSNVLKSKANVSKASESYLAYQNVNQILKLGRLFLPSCASICCNLIGCVFFLKNETEYHQLILTSKCLSHVFEMLHDDQGHQTIDHTLPFLREHLY